jgi:hypothetical protein
MVPAMELILSGAIGAAAALTGSLGAILIAGRQSLRMARMQAAEERRREARRLATEIVMGAGVLNATLASVVIMVSTMLKLPAIRGEVVGDLVREVEPLTDSTRNLAHQATLFRMTVSDVELRELAESIGRGCDQVGIQFAGLAGAFAASDGKELPLSTSDAFLARAKELGGKIIEFDALLCTRLSEPLPPSSLGVMRRRAKQRSSLAS